MVELTDADFRANTQSGVWVIHFWSKNCSPCKPLAKMLDSLQSEIPHINFASINAELNIETAIEYHVRGYPTVIVMSNGEPLEYIFGLYPESILKHRILLSIQENNAQLS